MAAPIKADHVEVSLISDSKEGFERGQIGVYYKLESHWHIYWKSPGDSGAAPKVLLGSKSVGIEWPYPKRIPVSHLVNFGYEEDTLLFLDLPQGFKSKTLNLEWLACKIDCVPGFAKVEISEENVTYSVELWSKFKDRLPAKQGSIKTKFKKSDGDTFQFSLAFDFLPRVSQLHIFPEDTLNFGSQAPSIQVQEDTLLVSVPKAVNYSQKTEVNRFVAVAEMKDGSTQSFQFDVEVKSSFAGFLWGIVLAVLGGLILNLMPCVFPVLFLKAYSFAKLTDLRAVKFSSWMYSLGVLISFLILGSVIVILKVAGQNLGWGFQLQNPYFVMALIILFVIMSLSFLDIIRFENFRPPRALGPMMSSDFGTGILAVVVASPCTAPFMGAALGLTLVLPPVQSLLIFVSLGIGLAMPILFLAHMPGLIRLLPRSGHWMMRVKKLMAIPLLLTAVWLSWVLYVQVGDIESSKEWQDYNVEEINSAKKKRPVFIDFTAAWCITCQVNKQSVLHTQEILELFKQNNVYLVKADWTNYDKTVTDALLERGRNSVPLYVYYDPSKRSEVILPELLTKKMIKDLFIKGRNK